MGCRKFRCCEKIFKGVVSDDFLFNERFQNRFGSSVCRGIGGGSLEGLANRLGQELFLERYKLGQNKRLVIPKVVTVRHLPVDKCGHRAPFCDSPIRACQLDRLATKNLLDFMACHSVQRLDSACLHHSHLAERFGKVLGIYRSGHHGPDQPCHAQ